MSSAVAPPNAPNGDRNDSEDSDSDYDPTMDADADEDNEDSSKALSETLAPAMGTYRRRAADDALAEMCREDSSFLKAKVQDAVVAYSGRKKVGKKRRRRLAQALEDVFGKSAASGLLGKGGRGPAGAGTGPKKKKKKKQQKESGAAVAGKRQRPEADEALRERARKAARSVVSEKVKVTQTVKFAGAETTVTKTVAAHSREAQLAKEGPAQKSGLESVLDDIKGPKKISTLEKTSVDWDGYKEEHKLDDDIGKGGYLEKQDFLNRCDVRSFHNEKAERDVIRSKQQAAAKK